MDLNMPIMDGFESCVQILNHSKLIQRQQLIQPSANENKVWIGNVGDLKSSYLTYLQLIQEVDSKLHPRLQHLMGKIFFEIKQQALDSMQKPFIIAYSAHVNKDVLAKT